MEIHLPQNVVNLIDRLEEEGYPSFVVGGCIRDILLGREVRDWDICTAATPNEVMTVFKECKIIETGRRHGTVTVFIGSEGYEITTFRLESTYSDNRHPDQVEFVRTLDQDVKRRDFTINAIAYNKRLGLVDLVGGVEDLNGKIIRCVGDPDQRFGEDGLRILRTLRFASTLGFKIDKTTSDAVFRNKELLNNISAERIRDEFDKLICGPGVETVLRQYAEIIAVFIPEIVPMIGFRQYNKYHDMDVWEHTIKTIINIPPDPLLRLTMLLHDIAKPECFYLAENGRGHFTNHPHKGANKADTILRRLKYDNETIDLVHTLIFSHNGLLMPEPKYVKKWLNKVGPELMEKVLLVKSADAHGKCVDYLEEKLDSLEKVAKCIDEIIQDEQCFKLKDLAINGKDLLELGIPQGKQIGDLLDLLLQKVINEEIANYKEILIEEVKRLLKNRENTKTSIVCNN